MRLGIKKQKLKFIVSGELGRLARWLRILGYDTAYFDLIEKRELIINSLREERVILTRNSSLRDHHGLKMVYIKSERIEEQLKQLAREFVLRVDEHQLFNRCVICNQLLEKISKDKVLGKVPPYVFKTVDHFNKCPGCKKIYWTGTHSNKVKEFVASLGILRRS
jgi:uncharacterized protein with PIN domain